MPFEMLDVWCLLVEGCSWTVSTLQPSCSRNPCWCGCSGSMTQRWAKVSVETVDTGDGTNSCSRKIPSNDTLSCYFPSRFAANRQSKNNWCLGFSTHRSLISTYWWSLVMPGDPQLEVQELLCQSVSFVGCLAILRVPPRMVWLSRCLAGLWNAAQLHFIVKHRYK